jgi:pyrroloquinoline-quinone synthase
MTPAAFLHELEARIAKYDLLCHPFYKAWSAGELTRDDLREYAQDYFPHVEAFPAYLAQLAVRLEDGELRKNILANMADEKGSHDARPDATPHSDMWLDFAEGMGASRDQRGHKTVPAMKKLISFFDRVSATGSVEQALAAFYAYESQVPRIAKEKARGLKELYGADAKTYSYFTLHETADLYHSQVWRDQLVARIEANQDTAQAALDSAETAAKALWSALDGIYEKRMALAA